jgi:hypothetical protein
LTTYLSHEIDDLLVIHWIRVAVAALVKDSEDLLHANQLILISRSIFSRDRGWRFLQISRELKGDGK